MDDILYREIILEHYEHPLNYGEVKNPDLDTFGVNPLCGDEIRITAKINKGRVEKIAFTSNGCAISKAAASMFTETVRGMKIAEIEKMEVKKFLDKFGIDFSPARVKCALLGFSTLKKALKMV